MKKEKRVLHGNQARVDPDTQLHSPLEALIPPDSRKDKQPASTRPAQNAGIGPASHRDIPSDYPTRR